MKPIAIFRHFPIEGPGYLGDFLDRQAVPWELIRIDAGDKLPKNATEFAGLVFMGGPMSVNDDLPWIPQSLALIQGAVAVDIPVMGHCLGGQLMCKALGGVVGKNLVKEIGWGEVRVAASVEAERWFGGVHKFLGFHWHGETFSIPEGGYLVLSSEYCRNQAFSLGKHIGFQCHIEMTADMVRAWCQEGREEITQAAKSLGVQQAPDIVCELEARVSKLNAVAEVVYTQWLKGVRGR